MEGAREAGGTKTCTGARAKQKTAAPQGAASLSLAVLESDGRKREAAIDSEARWVRGRRKMDNLRQQAGIVDCPCKQNERIGDGYTRTLSKLSRGARLRLRRLSELGGQLRSPPDGRNWRAVGRAAYWLPAARVPALRMEEAAAKMRAAL